MKKRAYLGNEAEDLPNGAAAAETQPDEALPSATQSNQGQQQPIVSKKKAPLKEITFEEAMAMDIVQLQSEKDGLTFADSSFYPILEILEVFFRQAAEIDKLYVASLGLRKLMQHRQIARWATYEITLKHEKCVKALIKFATSFEMPLLQYGCVWILTSISSRQDLAKELIVFGYLPQLKKLLTSAQSTF